MGISFSCGSISSLPAMCFRYLLLIGLLILTLLGASHPALAQPQGPGFPNIARTPGALIGGPVGTTTGRTAIVFYHQGYVGTVAEGPGSNPGSDLLARRWDISNPANPVGIVNQMHHDAAAAAHGYWQSGNIIYGFGNSYSLGWTLDAASQNYLAVDPSMADPVYYWQGASAPWPGRGLAFQPFHMSMWWNYGPTNNLGKLYKRNQELATWDHIALTSVIGHPFLIGNILYILSDDTRSGIAAYDIRTSLQNPGTPPQLIGVLNAAVGGYFPSVWGGGGKLLAFFPARQNGRFFVADITNPYNMFVIGDRQLPAGDLGYVQFQDDFAFVDRYKIPMNDPNFNPVLSFNVGSSTGTDMGQMALPIGNLIAAGGSGNQGLTIWAHQAAPDTHGPEVGFHIPRANETNYPVGAPITLLIHETLRTETIINGTSFSVRPLVGGTPGTPVAGRITFSSDDVLTFTPDSDLAPNTTYLVSLPTGGIRDAANNGMVGYSYQFSTGTTISGGANTPPTITAFSAQPYPAAPQQIVTFNFAANDPQGVEYKVSFGDGTPESAWQFGTSIQHAYSAVGHYSAVLTARDSLGATSIKRFTVTVLSSLPSGARPTSSSSVVYDSANDVTWVVNPDSHTVSRISASSLQEIALAQKCHPRSVALDSTSRAWVTCQDRDEIKIVNSNGSIAQTITLPYGSQPFSIVANPAGNQMFVSMYGRGKLMRISTSNLTQATVDLGATPRAIAINAAGSRALVTRYISPDNEGQVWNVDVASSTMSVVSTISLPKDIVTANTASSGRGVPNYLAGVAYHPLGNTFWVTSKKDNIDGGLFNSGIALGQENTVRAVATEVNVASGAVISQRDIDNSDSPIGVLFSPLGDYAFIALQGNNAVAVYDTLVQVSVLNPALGKLGVELAPQGLAYDATHQRLLVQNFTSRSLSRLELGAFLQGASMNAATSHQVTTTMDTLNPQVLQGKRIFYNASDMGGPNGTNRMSGMGYISCATCHADGGHDGRTWDFTQRGEGLRNTTDLRGRAGMAHGLVHWSGNFDEIQDFENDIRNNFGGRGFMSDTDFAATSAPLGAPKAGRSQDLDALAAYVTSLGTASYPRSPYRNADGSRTATAESAIMPMLNMGCFNCHTVFRLTDSTAPNLTAHNVGTMSASSGLRLGQPLTGIDTPTLFGLFESAPYFHDGAAASIDQVFESPGGGLKIQAEDANQLVSAQVELYAFEGSAHEQHAVTFPSTSSNPRIVFNNIPGGPGGAGYITIRYSSMGNAVSTNIVVNGVQQTVSLPLTPNYPSWYPNAFSTVTVPVNFAAGNNNTVEIVPVFFWGYQMAFDEILVRNPSHLLAADSHRRVLNLSASQRAAFRELLLSIDGGDDYSQGGGSGSFINSILPTPTPTPQATPTSGGKPGVLNVNAPKVRISKTRGIRVSMTGGGEEYLIYIKPSNASTRLVSSRTAISKYIKVPRGVKLSVSYRLCQQAGSASSCSARSPVTKVKMS